MILTRRFLPYFITQCLGALNDNVYKNVLLLLVTYSQIGHLPIDINLFVNLAAGLFILPFFLFSAHAGLIADNMDKALLIQRLKLLEVIIMCCGALAIVTQSYLLMLVLLFLMGTQSAFFGPVKYSLLPKVLTDTELVRGNAWVEMGTFISILFGTITAGLIVASDHAQTYAAISVFVLACIGYISSRFIPPVSLSLPAKKLRFTPLSGSLASIKKVKMTHAVWMAVLAISWFWFLGATYLTQFPNFARLHLNAGATVVSLLLALFSIGIAVGSLLCERLSFKRVELGIIPFGLLGLSLFGIDLYFSIPVEVIGPLYHATSFVIETLYYRLMFDLFMIGVSGGLFIVPLYSFIQARAKEGQCAQAIAANNIMNALFMVISAIFSILFLGPLGGTILELFLLLGISNLVILGLLFVRWSELRLRFATYLLSRYIFPISVNQPGMIPKEGGALLVGSSEAAKELLLIQSLSVRPILFMPTKVEERSLFAKLLRSSAQWVNTPARRLGGVNDSSATHTEGLAQAVANGELIYISAAELNGGGIDIEGLGVTHSRIDIALKNADHNVSGKLLSNRRVHIVLTAAKGSERSHMPQA